MEKNKKQKKVDFTQQNTVYGTNAADRESFLKLFTNTLVAVAFSLLLCLFLFFFPRHDSFIIAVCSPHTHTHTQLARNLPPRTIGYPWTLAFGTSKHGMSIKTLYRAMQGQDTPVLLVIKDSDGQVFGALASEPFKVSDGFYGTGETFLFTFNPEFEVYKWTGDNMFFIKGDMDSLAFGGGSGEFGLWLDGDLYHGRSHSCKTFGNPMLSKKEDFYVQDIEVWAFE
uniref:TLDc domain-containing protein n=1 Tax=Xiphophorus couchianus TaxID=32473 RepID=A0A3B5MTF0_9TELE